MSTSEHDIPQLFHPYVRQIFELETFVQVAWAGLGYAEFAERIADLRKPRVAGDPDMALLGQKRQEVRLEWARKLEAFAKNHKDSGFSYLYGLAAVRLWAILEAVVDKVIQEVLTHHPQSWDSDRVRRLKGPLIEFVKASEEERAAYLAELLSDDIGARLKPGVARFECLLSEIGLDGSIPDAVKRRLLELSGIRNVVVHRNYVADERFVERCPWLLIKPGDVVSISSIQFEKYVLASHFYVLELSMRWLQTFPEGNKGELEEIQNLQVELSKVVEYAR